MLATKQIFEIDRFMLESGKEIPLKLGYETYGTLSEKKDNVVLVSHYFTSTSHAAGLYDESDEQAGYWDSLIGKGKVVDTDKYFVISVDNICNIQVKNPKVVTIGPATINKETGEPYCLCFPPVTTLDLANSQKILLESLGIKKVKVAMGPSLGGMIGMQLAIHYPEFVEKYIGVVTAPYNTISPSFQYNVWHAAKADKNFNNGNYYGKEEPKEALDILAKNLLLSIYSPDFLEKLFPRDHRENGPYESIFEKTCYEKKLDVFSQNMISLFDLNSWIYASRITMNHDIRRGFENLEEAVSKIKAKVLMISNRQDMLENWRLAENMVNAINEVGGNAKFIAIDNELGHMAGMFATDLFAKEIADFLQE